MATPKALIFRTAGTNCDRETVHAFRTAGAETDLVHLNRVLASPEQIFDYDMTTRDRKLRKQQEVPSGHRIEDYVTRRFQAPAHDGESVPVTLLYHRLTKLDTFRDLGFFGPSYKNIEDYVSIHVVFDDNSNIEHHRPLSFFHPVVEINFDRRVILTGNLVLVDKLPELVCIHERQHLLSEVDGCCA